MRLDVYLKVKSSSVAIKFYVDELGLFKVVTDYGMNAYLLCAVANPDLCLQIAESEGKTMANAPVFGIGVANCDQEFRRLQAAGFSTGARLVPDHNGEVGVFEWPGGKNFCIEDPSGNQFHLFEDWLAPTV